MSSLKTEFGKIVSIDAIGTPSVPIPLPLIMERAGSERLTPAVNNSRSVLFLGIDLQQDFMDNGSLGVPGAVGDIERLTKFLYTNMDEIHTIAVSLDTHFPQQIFHPYWWKDKYGNDAPPFTVITLPDIDSGTWRAVRWPKESREYVAGLAANAKKDLVIWPYHCIQGTAGHALENQFASMVYFHSVAKRSVPRVLVKGFDPLSEMYGIIRPEFDRKNYYDINFLNFVETFDMVVIAGEAKSHCVCESIKQMLDHYAGKSNAKLLKNIYILEDCMSVIPGSEDSTRKAFDDFKSKFDVNLVQSTDPIFQN